MFLIFKKKTFFIVLLCLTIIFASSFVYFSVKPTSNVKPQLTIVLDAGHGGIDVK